MHSLRAFILAAVGLLVSCSVVPNQAQKAVVESVSASSESPSPTPTISPVITLEPTPAPTSASPATAEVTPEPTSAPTSTPVPMRMADLVYSTSGGTWWTFDDCERLYLPGTVANIVAVLQKYGVSKATFFMNGSCFEDRKDLVATITRAGFEIGNHAHDHMSLSRLSLTGIVDQIKRGPAGAKLFRAPNWDVAPMVRVGAYQAGYPIVIMASVMTGDSSEANTCPVILRNIGRPGPTSIVSMHMTNRDSPKALEAYFSGRGC